MGVGARPEKWEGTGWGVVSEEEPGWIVLFRAPLPGFFYRLQTWWAHPEAEAPTPPEPREGSELGRSHLSPCIGAERAEDTGGESYSLSPAAPRAFAGTRRSPTPHDGHCLAEPGQDYERTLERRSLAGLSASLPKAGDGEQRVGSEGLCGPPRGHQLAEPEPRRATPADGQRGRHGPPLEHRGRPVLRAPAR